MTIWGKCAREDDYPIELVVGSGFVAGRARMKAGTAQKSALNIILTTDCKLY